MLGKFSQIAFVRSLTGAASRSGRKPASSGIGSETGVPPASRVDTPYTGYPGSGISASSPGSTNANAMCPIPSFEPIIAMTSVSGSSSTPKRRSYQRATA